MISKIVDKYAAFVFDMDNTLYDEKQYLFNAYKKISEYLADRCNKDEKYIYTWLTTTFEADGRHQILDRLMEHLHLEESRVKELVYILRNAKPDIQMELFPAIKNILKEMVKKDKSIFVLTNGNPNQQKNKVNHLFLDDLANRIQFYYANEYQPKPAPDGLEHIIETHQLTKKKVLFIGDALIDQKCAQNAGVDFVYVHDLKAL